MVQKSLGTPVLDALLLEGSHQRVYLGGRGLRINVFSLNLRKKYPYREFLEGK